MTDDIDVTQAKITDLQPDPHNANLGTERGQGLLEESLRDLGAGRSILLDKHNRIIAGNKTAAKAAELGMNDVIVVRTDGSQVVAVQRVDLDLAEDPEAVRLAILDNRVAEIDLQWDPAVLAALSEEKPEVVAGLWDSKEFQAVLNGGEENTPPKKRQRVTREVTIKCPHCGHAFDLEEIVSLRQ